MIHIEKITREESQELSEFAKATFWDTFAEYNTLENMVLYSETNFLTSVFEKLIDSPSTHFYWLLHNGEKVGYLQLNKGSSPLMPKNCALEIERLYLDKKVHGIGLGKKLMEFSLTRAKELELDEIWLGVWENNHRAISFYESFGFVHIGEHEFFLGKDIQRDLLYSKKLD